MRRREFISITKALADENRIRFLVALVSGELCVCQLTELSGLAPSTTSKHLSILYKAGLVNTRKEGRWIFYTLAGKEAPRSVRAAIRWVLESLAKDAQTQEDLKRLKSVLAIDPAELCKRQCKN